MCSLAMHHTKPMRRTDKEKAHCFRNAYQIVIEKSI